MSAAIIGIRRARDEAGRLQPVEQANDRSWPDVENLSEGGLIETFVLRKVDEDSASCASHAWKPRAQLSVVATARQPSCLMQQAHNRIGIVGAGIIIGLRSQPRGRGLLQQMADGRFLRPVPTHEQLHDRFGQDLIKRRLIASAESRRLARAAVPSGADLSRSG
jgi:hypothetical protein